jgi:hypothetical protein
MIFDRTKAQKDLLVANKHPSSSGSRAALRKVLSPNAPFPVEEIAPDGQIRSIMDPDQIVEKNRSSCAEVNQYLLDADADDALSVGRHRIRLLLDVEWFSIIQNVDGTHFRVLYVYPSMYTIKIDDGFNVSNADRKNILQFVSSYCYIESRIDGVAAEFMDDNHAGRWKILKNEDFIDQGSDGKQCGAIAIFSLVCR